MWLHRNLYPAYLLIPLKLQWELVWMMFLWMCQCIFILLLLLLFLIHNSWSFLVSQKKIYMTKKKQSTVECFLRFGFVVQNIGRQCDLANFWPFHTWIESFFNSVDLIKPYKLNWVDKRLNSSVKMWKICQITLSADVFTTKHNLRKHSTVEV